MWADVLFAIRGVSQRAQHDQICAFRTCVGGAGGVRVRSVRRDHRAGLRSPTPKQDNPIRCLLCFRCGDAGISPGRNPARDRNLKESRRRQPFGPYDGKQVFPRRFTKALRCRLCAACRAPAWCGTAWRRQMALRFRMPAILLRASSRPRFERARRIRRCPQIPVLHCHTNNPGFRFRP